MALRPTKPLNPPIAHPKARYLHEHRDTLSYLTQRISTLLGRSGAVRYDPRGMGREERLKAQEHSARPEVQVCLRQTLLGKHQPSTPT